VKPGFCEKMEFLEYHL